MQPSSMALQNLARLPALALTQIRLIGQDLKNRMITVWQKVCDSFEKADVWLLMIKPLYDRYIKPLGKFDVVLLSGSLATAALIIILTPSLFGFAALPLGIAIGATLLGLAYCITRRRVEYYFEKEAWAVVDNMRDSVNAITHTNRTFEAVQKARDSLTKNEFDHLSKEWQKLDEQLNHLKGIVLNDNLGKTEKILNETKKAVLTYLEGLLSRLDPKQKAKPLPSEIRVGDTT